MHVWIDFSKASNRGRHGAADKTQPDANAHFADTSAPPRLNLRLRRCEFGHRELPAVGEHLADGRWPDTIWAAFQQLHAQRIFKLRHCLTHRLLRNAERLCRAPKVAVLNNGQELAQFVGVDWLFTHTAHYAQSRLWCVTANA